MWWCKNIQASCLFPPGKADELEHVGNQSVRSGKPKNPSKHCSSSIFYHLITLSKWGIPNYPGCGMSSSRCFLWPLSCFLHDFRVTPSEWKVQEWKILIKKRTILALSRNPTFQLVLIIRLAKGCGLEGWLTVSHAEGMSGIINPFMRSSTFPSQNPCL